jgi:hypothetical protein
MRRTQLVLGFGIVAWLAGAPANAGKDPEKPTFDVPHKPSVENWAEGTQALEKPSNLPNLLVLQFRAGADLGRFLVKVVPGVTEVPVQGVRPRTWAVLPGAAIDAPVRPPDRLVELYSGSAQQPTLICKIGVRYFRARDGLWMPHFQIIEEPLVVRRGDRWIPFTAVQGDANLIILTSSTLPNADGFYPALEFGFNGDTPVITFWAVR